MSDQSVINVNAGANIKADLDIQLLSRVKHFGGLSTALATIPGLSMVLNSINIKMANAIVNIKDGATLTAVGGSVTADAIIETVTGYQLQVKNEESSTGDDSDDESSNGNESDVGSFPSDDAETMPLAVTIVLNDAAITVENGAEIVAGNNILMNADSQVKVKTLASSDTVPSPIDIALTIIDNKATVLVGGSHTAGNEILLNANGNVTALKKGSCTIAVKTSNGKLAKVKIKVS